MKQFAIGDLHFNPQTVEALRNDLIQMRDHALKASAFDWAVSLSHAIALLGYIQDELEP